MNNQHIYIAIDLKSFYASVECIYRNLDPMTTNLVVADDSRTEKTICLAVSPSLRAFGIPGRARLFEVSQKVREINHQRLSTAIRNGKAVTTYENGKKKYGFLDSSHNADVLSQDFSLGLSYITAPPRMARYLEVSTQIYNIYLKYIAPEDIHVYSIDEVFIDATNYLETYHMTAQELTMTMIREVLGTTGITATAGVGTNLYLAKVAMDIVAKHIPANKEGVRIAELDELKYRQLLWTHEPLTDFWRVGRGYSKKLQESGLFTMGDIARCSIGTSKDFYNEDLLYRLFGINAELLIDHAWGWEPCTIADVKSYKPENNSLGSGQVLQCPYTAEKGKLITCEMTDLLVLDLVDKELVTNQIVLTVGYDIENLSDENRRRKYKGPVTTDHYGRKVPKHAHGTGNIGKYTSSTMLIMKTMTELYDRIVDNDLLVRRISISFNHIIPESEKPEESPWEQLDLFTDYSALEEQRAAEKKALERERQIQKATLDIQKKFGKNAILKGTNLEEGAMTKQRNKQIGGHKA